MDESNPDKACVVVTKTGRVCIYNLAAHQWPQQIVPLLWLVSRIAARLRSDGYSTASESHGHTIGYALCKDMVTIRSLFHFTLTSIYLPQSTQYFVERTLPQCKTFIILDQVSKYTTVLLYNRSRHCHIRKKTICFYLS